MSIRFQYIFFILFVTFNSHASFDVTEGPNPGEPYTKIMNFKLANNISLDSIADKFGKVILNESGEAGEYWVRLCYFFPKTQAYLLFESGELGGPQHELLGYTISVKKPIESDSCYVIDEKKHSFPIIKGIKIGMSQKEIKKLFEKPIRVNKDTLVYSYWTKTKVAELIEKHLYLKPTDNFDVVITLTFIFKKDQLVKFRVWKTITY